jgi:nucleotide-binding universal stress UspA family protein
MSEPTKTMHSIVIAVGPEYWDDPALPAAMKIARSSDARLHVVRAFDPPGGPAQSADDIDHEAVTHRREEILTGLCGQVDALGGGSEVRCHVLLGSPAEVVARVSADTQADLVVVGAARRENLPLRFLGTKAERIVMRAPCPVLVLREPVTRPVRNVLFSIGPLPESARILDGGRTTIEGLFAEDRPKLRLLTVTWDPPGNRESGGPAEEVEAAREALESLIADRAVEDAEMRVRTGMPAGEILAEAREWPADLVVLGTRGRTGSERVLMGSVCASVLRDLGRNALVIPPESTPESARRPVGEESAAGGVTPES